MKRSGPLERKSPLQPGKGLQRSVGWDAAKLRRSTLHRRQATSNRRNTGPTAAVRRLVHARSGGWCEWLGCWLVASQIHHRRPRRMGGSSDPTTNHPSNLIDLCVSCHSFVESHRMEAIERGFLLYAADDPRTTPVLLRSGLVLLNDQGGYSPTTSTPEEG